MKYEVYLEVGVTLEVEVGNEEGALILAKDALQIDAFPGYDTRVVDQFILNEVVRIKDKIVQIRKGRHDTR